MDALTAEQEAWCLARIHERLGGAAPPPAIESVPSRLAGVWRIRTPGGPAFYLKRYPPEEPRYAADLAEHFSLLQSVAQVVARESDLAPYVAVACRPDWRMILSEETPGHPIAALHRDLPRRAAARAAAERGWAGVARWLSALHAQRQTLASSQTRSAELADYTCERFDRWAGVDPAQTALARDAAAAVRRAARSLAGQPIVVVPCHGDVSAHNIMVGSRIGLIDFDDLRWDLPAVDLSQALLEMAQFARIASLLPVPGMRARLTRAFTGRYAGPWPEGGAFWLPHLRNLAVFVLTLAQRRGPLSLSSISTRAHYRTTIGELRRAIAAVP